MKLKYKYLKCFSQEKSTQLSQIGYLFLYEQNGVYYHQNNEEITINFSNNKVLDDVKFSTTVNF